MKLTALIVFTIICVTILTKDLNDKTLSIAHKKEILVLKEEILTLYTEKEVLKDRITSLENELRECRVLKATVTAYSPTPEETDIDPFITASLQPVREGGVAVSRDLFYAGWVFGRQIYIEGYGIFVITDLMHKRKTKQIDIFKFDTKEALNFGRKQLRVALLN